MAAYKTIILELLQEQYPSLHDQLRRERTLLEKLNRYAVELRTAHLAWTDELRRASPEADPASAGERDRVGSGWPVSARR